MTANLEFEYARLFVVKKDGSPGMSMPLRRERYTMGTDDKNDVVLKIPGAAPFHASLTRTDPTSCEVFLACEATDLPIVVYTSPTDSCELVHGSKPQRLLFGFEFCVGTRRFRYDSPDAPHRPFPPPNLSQQSAERAQQSLRTHGVLRPRDAANPSSSKQGSTNKKQKTSQPSSKSASSSVKSKQPPKTATTSSSSSSSSARSTRSSSSSSADVDGPAQTPSVKQQTKKKAVSIIVNTAKPRIVAPEGCLMLFKRGEGSAEERTIIKEVAQMCKLFHLGFQRAVDLIEHPGTDWHRWQYGGIIDETTGELQPDKKLVTIPPDTTTTTQ